jgi:hypothetical protein
MDISKPKEGTQHGLQIRLAYRKQAAALTNNKQDNFNKMHTYNIGKWSVFRIYRKKYQSTLLEVSEKYKNLP